ncbi:MAG TPA: glycoside hydrolase family 38 C-terminal domain-containing protein [Chthonomonadales bacterium]|nr:glycoside hydrolase family 38 C-terminal domain-containing protein [Chthonomonadales bacterium]
MADPFHVARKRIAEIGRRVVRASLTLDSWERRAARHLGPGQYEWLEEGAPAVDVGGVWGSQGQTVFLRRRARVPEEWAGLKVGLEMRTAGEGLLRVDGEPHHGVDDNRGLIVLALAARGGEEWDLEVELKPGGYLEYVARSPRRPYVLEEARLAAVDPAMEAAWLDLRVAHEAAGAIRDPALREAMLAALVDALREADLREQAASGLAEGLAAAREKLRTGLSALQWGRHPGAIFFAGHSHIDLAWLWPIRETMRKVGRTYSTVDALMEEFPHYHFVCSQAPLFLWLKRDFPTVYERVKRRVAEGRFEPVGGTWVENDCNVVSGESLVRQCLYGQRFFRDELGVRVRVGWLPDVFGYSWAMPQVYRKAGLDYFMTAKVAWNESNRIPWNTFWWQGADGSRLLTQLVHNLGNMYNAQVQPSEMLRQWDDFADKRTVGEALCPYGFGDGGGGPTRQMLEFLPRLAAMPGMPRAATGRVHDFFDRIAERAGDGLPVWNGELYFERHRGTYTTRAWNKRCNRRAELTLREAEIWSVAAAGAGAPYPAEAIREAWQTTLLNQFHDILPGSSIDEVYRDSDRDYEAVLETAERLRSDAMQALARRVDTLGEGQAVVAFNPLGWERTDVADIPNPGIETPVLAMPDGRMEPCQPAGDRLLVRVPDVPSLGWAVGHVRTSPEPPAPSPFLYEDGVLMTPHWMAAFGPDGTLRRLTDRRCERDVLPAGALANELQVFEDRPVSDEAWDIDLESRERMWRFQADGPPRLAELGPLYMALEQTLRHNRSTIDQRIVFWAHSRRIDFETRVDWQERKTLLKVAFPVQVHSPRATYEIAFGSIERPTHRNTSWDAARFEVSGHRWADLSETGYGVAVLNDSKYGWDIEGNVIRLTLLRSPEDPGPTADLGEHRFTYSLLPHAGTWLGSVVAEAHALNAPLAAVAQPAHAGDLPSPQSLAVVRGAPAVVIDTVKRAEDSDETVIRVYEALGGRMPVTVEMHRPIASAVECDLLEEGDAPVEREFNRLRFAIKPFEVRTFRVRLA